ncbi:MAG: two-component regulator propeller domain-containing protein [Bacteroidia bacterium]
MKTKILLLCSMILISFTAATNAQTNQWEVYNSNNSPLTGNSVTTVSTTSNSAWIGTTTGLNYFNGTQWTTLTVQSSDLPDNTINDIAREENGTLWIATNSGLAKLYDHEWTIYNSSNSVLPVNIIKCITIDEAGNKWIGTWGGGLVKFDNSNWTVYNTSNSQIPANGINSVTADSNGIIWLGTFSNGIGVLDNGNWTNYNTTNSALQSNDVKAIAFDKNDNTWIASANGIVRVNGNAWTFINHSITGFSFQNVNDVVCGDKIWFASDNGLIEFDGTHWLSHRVDNSSLPVNDVRALAMDENLNIWIATAGGGLAIYNSEGVALSVEQSEAAVNSLNVFPNPANGEVKFNFTTTEAGDAELVLYDVQGRKVCTLLNEEVSAGKHELRFDTNTLPAGVYIWWVRFKDRIDTMRLAVI